MNKERKSISDTSAGVNYGLMNPFKIEAQHRSRETSSNLAVYGMVEDGESRGESAYVVIDLVNNCGWAKTNEGLGTKNFVADDARQITGRSHYDTIAQDTVAAIINDLITSGAAPLIISSHIEVGDSQWFRDKQRTKDFWDGWIKACQKCGVTAGGGETAELHDLLLPNAVSFSGSADGIIKPLERKCSGRKIKPDDAIFLLESNGIHANGLSVARALARNLPDGYATKLPDGKNYAESLLTPSHLYSPVVQDLFTEGIDMHYMVNITGHGWRKIMRAKTDNDFSYIIESVPKPQTVFNFLQEKLDFSDEEMYGVFNMGAGFAILMPEKDVELAQKIALEKHGLQAGKAGYVENGPKQVVIKPKNIIFTGESLRVR